MELFKFFQVEEKCELKPVSSNLMMGHLSLSWPPL